MDHQDRNVVTEDRLEFERRMERNTSSECRAEGWRIPAAMMFVLVTARYFHTEAARTSSVFDTLIISLQLLLAIGRAVPSQR